MNKKNTYALLTLTALSFPVHSLVKKGDALVYGKSDGEISIFQIQGHPSQAKFKIITNVDMHFCNVEGIAETLSDSKTFTQRQWQDTNQCKITLKWSNKQIQVTATDECNSYCGLNADSSMNGIYR
ncbi:hypothetical protein QDW60_05205 [Escherichia coli]|uniref:Uncharacterized protein n=1 Tax=Escherichia marmotae TaxID=1499973 RepID=A0A7H9KED6_9ESCH|nr:MULTISPECIES: hypothetical protein [Escherichia]ECD4582999.1 hypothetical protein [Salmonella enterica subsp. enterica serovar Newport]QLV03273.1 hypothetical protein HV284_20560 [Escherichia marmotae]WHH28699.1 hypothetical protein QDW59_05200 [Escherichia coli]WHH83235.1 hypothetical protein QDW60_05205 [Escherichia coli]